MNDALGLIFAYTGGAPLLGLVEHRTASSLPFGGRYRAIDFLLSNMVNAGIHDVGIILRDGYQSLLDHLGSGKDWDLSRKLGGMALLPPFGYSPKASAKRLDAPFRGKMDALASVAAYIQKSKHRYVVLGDAHCVMNLRLDEVFDAHEKTGADITAVCASRPVGDPSQSVYLRCGGDESVTEISAYPEKAGANEALGVYILDKCLLERLINYGITHDMCFFEREVLRDMLRELKIMPFVFDGYVAKMQSIAGYFRHSMELLEGGVRADLFSRANPIYTRVRDEAPTYYGDSATVQNSLIADGCHIEGHVENSILFRGVSVAAGTSVKNSVVMQSGIVRENSFLNFIIADKNVTVQRDSMLIGNVNFPVVLSKGSTV